MIRIRDAGSGDLDALVALGERMLAESVQPFPPIERDCIREQLDRAIAMPNVFLIALAEDDGGPIGMIMGVGSPYPFSSRWRTASEFLFVLPERRGSIAAKRLVRRFLDWSGGSDVISALIGVSTGVTPERTGRFFERLGFQPVGMMYRKGN